MSQEFLVEINTLLKTHFPTWDTSIATNSIYMWQQYLKHTIRFKQVLGSQPGMYIEINTGINLKNIKALPNLVKTISEKESNWSRNSLGNIIWTVPFKPYKHFKENLHQILSQALIQAMVLQIAIDSADRMADKILRISENREPI